MKTHVEYFEKLLKKAEINISHARQRRDRATEAGLIEKIKHLQAAVVALRGQEKTNGEQGYKEQ